MSQAEKVILVIDDDPSLCELMEMLLLCQGYAVHLTNNGNEAMEKVKQHRYDLIILDLMMPVMDGLEFLTWLRQSEQSAIPVTMLTAVNQHKIQQQLLAAGASCVLGKPIDADLFIDQIASQLS